jgi:protein translocase SecG subunit
LHYAVAVVPIFLEESEMDPEVLRKKIKKWTIILAFFVVAALFYMAGLRTLLTTYILSVAILSILAVLIQSGKGGGLAASFGGVGGDSLLGARAATPIAKATYVMLALFLFGCALLAKMQGPDDVTPGKSPDSGNAPIEGAQ